MLDEVEVDMTIVEGMVDVDDVDEVEMVEVVYQIALLQIEVIIDDDEVELRVQRVTLERMEVVDTNELYILDIKRIEVVE